MGRSIKLAPETVEETRRLYVDQGMTITEIAKHLGITTTGVQRRLDRAGVARRKEFDKTKFGYDLLHQLYVVDKLSGARIGAKLGITTTQAFALLDHHRIPHRPMGKRRRELIDRDLLYKLYVVDNLYLSQITEIFSVSHAVIHYNLRQYGLTRPRGRRPRPRFDRDVLYQLYVTEGLTCKATGAKLGITIRQVLYLLERHEIPRRASGTPKRFDPGRELLHKLYSVERCSIQEMRERLGMSHGTIYKKLTQYGIRRPPPVGIPIRIDRDVLFQLYVTEGLTLNAAGAKLGVSGSTVAKEMRRHEIPTRPRSGRPR